MGHAAEVRAALIAWLMLHALTVAVASAQPTRPSVADPHHAYWVEGRVVDATGAGVVGVIVERVESASSDRPYAAGFDRAVTDATGAFRFAFSGLGLSTGRTWHLALRRAGCTTRIETVTLERGEIPGSAYEGDRALGLVLRLGPCP